MNTDISNSSQCGDLRAELFDEQLIRLSNVPDLLPPRSNGKRYSIKSVYRWTVHGIKGVRLEFARDTSGKITSVEAVERFISAISRKSNSRQSLTPRRRLKKIRAATKKVEKLLGLRSRDDRKGCVK